MRSAAPAGLHRDAPRVIIITPHVRQITEEFTAAFQAWHKREYGTDAEIDWRGPFGTSEIIKLLQAQYTASLKRQIDALSRTNPDSLLDPKLTLDAGFAAGEIGFDLAFGGGSFDHGRLKARETAQISVPVVSAGSPDAGLRQVMMTIADKLDPAGLAAGSVREFKADVSIAGRPPVRLRVPVDAVQGEAHAVADALANTPPVALSVETTKLVRDFGVPMSTPAGLSPEDLAPLGNGLIGSERLFDPDQFWIGTALSAFGIVYSRDLFTELNIPEPLSFRDLADPRLAGMVALADPRQSGSLTTAIDMILSSHVWRVAASSGWTDLLADRSVIERAIAAGHADDVEAAWSEAWRIMRRITANARYYAASSTKPPIDVSQGEAAAGLAIDFYGKSQAQAVLGPGEDPSKGRVGYIDPLGETNYDADPISLLRGAPNPDLARRFIRFCLTREAQALWQFPARSRQSGTGGDGLGPMQHELRRLPIRADMYEPADFARFIDKVKPFERAPKAKPVGWRDAILVMLPAFSVDVLDEQRAAWDAIRAAQADTQFPREVLHEMFVAFDAFPDTTLADGRILRFTPQDFPALAKAWKDAKGQGRLKSEFTLPYAAFFRAQYRDIVRMYRAAT